MSSNKKILELLKIDELFKRKKWEIEEKKSIRESLYHKYLDRYYRLNDDCKDLFLELSDRFLRIKADEVYPIFRDTYNKIPNDFLDEFDNIHILPLIKPYIELTKPAKKVVKPKVKSGEKIKMFLELSEYRELKHSQKISLPDDFDCLCSTFNKTTDLLILIDDFIGTGKTANDILDVIFENNLFNSGNTIILTLVAQEIGANKIYEENQVLSFFEHLKDRAISDFYVGDDIEVNKAKVLEMEKSIQCPKRWSLGYKKTEALVSIMNKSPNNTLPVFWYETDTMIAPFKRYVNYK